MRALLRALIAFCFAGLAAFTIHAQDLVQLFGGYSYVRASVPVNTTVLCPVGLTPCPVSSTTSHSNLNGWELSGTYKRGHILGFTGDFGETYGTTKTASTHLHTYLFGPQLSLGGPVSPFAHVLIGAAHEAVGNSSANSSTIVVPRSDTSFATALGVGIDIKVAPFLSIRPIQIDYLVTRFHSDTQSQPRYAAGVVLHF